MKKREFLLCFILISIFTVFFIPSSFLASNREIVEFGSFPQNPDYIQEIVDQFDKQPGVKVIDGTKYLYEDGRLYPFEPIRWIVLSEGGDNALLVSEKVLFTSGWNNDGWYEETMWSDGRVRKLLNNWFYDMAFDNAEKDCIHTSTNKTILRTSADGDTYDVETTEDNVFILSMAELPDAKEDCIAYPTKYSGKDSTKPCTYFARDIAEYLFMQGPVYVNKEGATIKDVPNANHGVRPAIRVNLSKIRSVNADKEKAKIKSLSNATIKLQKTSYKYDGKVKRPEVTVLYEGKELSPSNYTVDYLNNKYAGTAVVEATGTGRFSGTVKTTFTIKPGKKVTISFNGNGGKASKKSIKVKAGSKYGTLPSAKWKGYKFLGWFTKKKGGEKISETSSLEAAKKQTLYAQWEKEIYTISYELNGGTNSKKNPNTYTITTKTFSFKNPTRNGYNYKGWYTDSKFKKSIKKITKGSSGNKTLYARWDIIKYKITYKLNGGKNASGNPGHYTTENEYSLKNPSKSGYVFQGWYNGSTEITVIKKGTTGNLTLTAKWKKSVLNTEPDVTSFLMTGFENAIKDFRYPVQFSDDYFSVKYRSNVEHQEIAKLSAVAALTTYTSGKTQELLRKCGFNSFQSGYTGANAHGTRGNNDHATIYLAQKPLKDGSILIAVIINGYSQDGYEWISNFNLGNGKEHAGFKAASDEVTREVVSYINQKAAGKKVKLWITGHSRGAAITNLVAKQMTDELGDASRVYAYGFATPQYTQTGSGYNNIINYYSPEDFVPYVAPSNSGWGYYRLGQNIKLTNKSAMESFFRLSYGRNYNGYSVGERETLSSAFVKLGGSQKEFYSKKIYYTDAINVGDGFIDVHGIEQDSVTPEKYCKEGLALACTKGWFLGYGVNTVEGVTNIAKYSNTDEDAKTIFNLLIEGEVLNSKVSDSHGMLTYLAWIQTRF